MTTYLFIGSSAEEVLSHGTTSVDSMAVLTDGSSLNHLENVSSDGVSDSASQLPKGLGMYCGWSFLVLPVVLVKSLWDLLFRIKKNKIRN